MPEHLDSITLFYRFGSALLLGMLVGLQREYASKRSSDERRELFAGTRTYALFAVLGCTAALISTVANAPLVVPAVLLVMGVIIAISYRHSVSRGHLGMTSEVAAFITLFAGALCMWGELRFAAALAVTTTVLLALKLHTRSLASRLTDEDVRATLTFAVLTLVILPVLPRHGFGPAPFDVLVPHKIWLMVVLISGLSFCGYVMIQVIGPQRGVTLTGLLGGLASSTAVTLSFAARSHTAEGLARPFALAILLAWTMMFVRVLVEVTIINRPLLAQLALPLGAATAVSLVYCAYLYFSAAQDTSPDTEEFENPFELAPALGFGALYMLILLVANSARLYFGDAGLYASSIAAGLADVDAITLSMAHLSRAPDGLAADSAARAIVLAAAANTLVKAGIVLSTGAPALKRVIWPGLVASLGIALGVVFVL
ncbi:MAG: MgtC/SapB family protein [Gammaproteobacteria bacterium]|nr:MgtC/SapB family protein [Gammaproteobacteria bacterium]